MSKSAGIANGSICAEKPPGRAQGTPHKRKCITSLRRWQSFSLICNTMLLACLSKLSRDELNWLRLRGQTSRSQAEFSITAERPIGLTPPVSLLPLSNRYKVHLSLSDLQAEPEFPSRPCQPEKLDLQFNASLRVNSVVAPERVVVEGEEVVVPGVISGQFTGIPHALDGEGRGGTTAECCRCTADRQGQQAQQESLIGVGAACARRHFICYAGISILLCCRKIPRQTREIAR